LRIGFVRWVGVVALACVALPPAALAQQNPATMMPEASAAKAKQLLNEMIAAMGGPAYLNAKESMCSGRRSQFGHNNDLTTYVQFTEYWRFPDNYRIDYGKKGNIIDSFMGKEGWTVDHDGVSAQPAETVQEFQERLRKNPNDLLRFRLNEPGTSFRYGGQDIIDLKPVDWVELVDRDQRTYRFAVARENHLLARFTVISRDEQSLELVEEVTSYSNYHALDGVQTPLQTARTRNGRRMFQAFYDSCSYHPNLAPDFFTRGALERRFDEVGSSADKKKAARSRN